MGRGAWQAEIYGVAKSRTRLQTEQQSTHPKFPVWETCAWSWPQGSRVYRWQGGRDSQPLFPPALQPRVANLSSVHWEKQVDDAVVTDFPFWLLRHFLLKISTLL